MLIEILVQCFIINTIVVCAYCIISDFRDHKLKNDVNKTGISITKSNKESIVKRIVVFLFYRVFYGWVRYNVILVGKIPSYCIRYILYRFIFRAKITGKTYIAGGCEIRSPWNLVADKCIIMNGCILDARNGIFIGNNVVFGTGVHVWTEEHNMNDSGFRVLDENRGSVKIMERAWICSDSTILPGVTVGEGAVLASRACATKHLDDFKVYAGVPAKRISNRNKDIDYELPSLPGWFFW